MVVVAHCRTPTYRAWVATPSVISHRKPWDCYCDSVDPPRATVFFPGPVESVVATRYLISLPRPPSSHPALISLDRCWESTHCQLCCPRLWECDAWTIPSAYCHYRCRCCCQCAAAAKNLPVVVDGDAIGAKLIKLLTLALFTASAALSSDCVVVVVIGGGGGGGDDTSCASASAFGLDREKEMDWSLHMPSTSRISCRMCCRSGLSSKCSGVDRKGYLRRLGRTSTSE